MFEQYDFGKNINNKYIDFDVNQYENFLEQEFQNWEKPLYQKTCKTLDCLKTLLLDAIFLIEQKIEQIGDLK